MISSRVVRELKRFGFVVSFPTVIAVGAYLYNSQISIFERRLSVCEQQTESAKTHAQNLEKIYSATSCSAILPEIEAQNTLYQEQIDKIEARLKKISSELNEVKITLTKKEELLQEKENLLKEKEVAIVQYQAALSMYASDQIKDKKKGEYKKEKKLLSDKGFSEKELNRQRAGAALRYSDRECRYISDSNSKLFVKCNLAYKIDRKTYAGKFYISSESRMYLNEESFSVTSIRGDVSEELVPRWSLSGDAKGEISILFSVPDNSSNLGSPRVQLPVLIGEIDELGGINIP